MSDTIFDFGTSKEEYRKFCEEKGEKLPIFMRDWYLDATVAEGAEWRVICIKENNQIVAVFPFQYMKIRPRLGMQLYHISNTFQQARGGIWIDYGNRDALCKREKFLMYVVDQIIERLPYYDKFCINFDLSFTDWSPFYWHKFEQTTYYSYIIDPKKYDGDQEKLFNSFVYDRRRSIRKAEEIYTVDNCLTGDEFYEFMILTYKEKGRNIQYSYETFHRLDEALSEHKAKKIYCARDLDGNVVAAVYMICDRQRWYWMFTAFIQKSKGAQELLTWAGMKDCLKHNIIYDFEGSMIPGVAGYIREYNAEKKPYYVISNSSKKMEVVKSLKIIKESLKKTRK